MDVYDIRQKSVGKGTDDVKGPIKCFYFIIKIIRGGNLIGKQSWNDVDYASDAAMSRGTEHICTN